MSLIKIILIFLLQTLAEYDLEPFHTLWLKKPKFKNPFGKPISSKEKTIRVSQRPLYGQKTIVKRAQERECLELFLFLSEKYRPEHLMGRPDKKSFCDLMGYFSPRLYFLSITYNQAIWAIDFCLIQIYSKWLIDCKENCFSCSSSDFFLRLTPLLHLSAGWRRQHGGEGMSLGAGVRASQVESLLCHLTPCDHGQVI